MTSSSNFALLTKEDLLKGLDGAAKVSLYDLVLSFAGHSWINNPLGSRSQGIIVQSYKASREDVELYYRIEFIDGKAGLPLKQSLIVRVPDRTCGGSYEYDMWGVTDVHISGTKVFNGFRVPDFGHPHPFELTPKRSWGWNNVYYKLKIGSDDEKTLLDREETGEIWKALMLLSVSVKRERLDNSLDIVKSRTEASERLVIMSRPPNTDWGD